MTAQHTPGPWTAKSLQVWSDQTGYGVACAQRAIFPTDEEMQIAYANARLIAAAPDLLAVVIHARNVLPNEPWADDTRKMLDAAIARATHKEQT